MMQVIEKYPTAKETLQGLLIGAGLLVAMVSALHAATNPPNKAFEQCMSECKRSCNGR
jgi:hypothetical protein